MATKTSKPQTGLLQPDDLGIASACLYAWARDAPKNQSRRLFAFFNSGKHSGASQAHRHLQFLPFEDMKGDSQNEWQLLIDRMTSQVASSPLLRQDLDLPFLHYATELSQDVSAHELHSKYIFLLRTAVCGLRKDSSEAELDENEHIERNGEAIISYNLAMTTDMMAIFPRRSEAAEVPSAGQAAGSVAINGTILGGTLMVKDENEWKTLRETPCILDDMLTTIGYPFPEHVKMDKTRL